MEFDFSSDQKQLRDQVRRFLGDRCDRAAVRRVLDTDATHDAELWKGLGELGYLGAAIPEAYGGLGAGYLELCVIAEELGRVVAPVPFSSSIALAAEMLLLAGSEAQKQRWLPLLASGEAIGTLALGEESGPLAVDRLQSRVVQGRLSGTKIAVAEGSIAHLAIVAALDEAGAPSLFVADLTGSGVHRDTVSTIDPTRDHATMRFDGVPVEPLGASGAAEALIRTVRDRAAVLVAFEQLGGADRALEMARDYALERFAFGRPIGSLQAIKHMLADMYVSEGASMPGETQEGRYYDRLRQAYPIHPEFFDRLYEAATAVGESTPMFYIGTPPVNGIASMAELDEESKSRISNPLQ
jgi:alkylation response protein AidB-like acyl-CoA dehydrogenase